MASPVLYCMYIVKRFAPRTCPNTVVIGCRRNGSSIWPSLCVLILVLLHSSAFLTPENLSCQLVFDLLHSSLECLPITIFMLSSRRFHFFYFQTARLLSVICKLVRYHIARPWAAQRPALSLSLSSETNFLPKQT
jgi:hypothetical protein